MKKTGEWSMDTNPTSKLEEIKRKEKYTGKVIKTTLAGAIVDIGLPTPGVVHISQLQKDPVNRVEDVVKVGQDVEVWVRRVYPQKGRIELTMVKPLDLEWRELKKDMVVKGKVTRIESFGVFVDIGAERPGLVHISELTHDYIKNPNEVVKEGDEVEVKVLGIDRKKKQIKLSMKALEERPAKPAKGESKEQAPKEAAVEPEKDEPTPTAMEMAMREAMQRSNKNKAEPKGGKEKSKGNKNELERILNRTLENKTKSQ
jgi:ribosomal protein S1